MLCTYFSIKKRLSSVKVIQMNFLLLLFSIGNKNSLRLREYVKEGEWEAKGEKNNNSKKI